MEETKDASNVTIGGTKIPLKKYIERQEEKEIRDHFKSEAGKYSYATHKAAKMKMRDSLQRQGVIWSKRYTATEIKKIERRSGKMKNDSARRRVVQAIFEMRNQGWFDHQMIREKIDPSVGISTLRTIAYHFYKFMDSKEMMERRFRGHRVEYRFLAAANDEHDIDKLYAQFVDQYKSASKRRKKSKRKDTFSSLPIAKIKPLLEQILGIKIDIEVRGQVDININWR